MFLFLIKLMNKPISKDALLSVSSLVCCVGDGNQLFQPVSFSLAAGDIIYIQGTNGSGKTSILEVLAGFSGDYTGDIFWKNLPRSAEINDDFLRYTRFLGHRLAVKESLTPLENLKWRLNLKGEFISQSSMEDALDQAGLSAVMDMPSMYLSEGQKHRMVLASLLLGKSWLWIMDEPHVLLDKSGWSWLDRCILNFVNNGGAVIMSSHQGFIEKIPKTISVRLTR